MEITTLVPVLLPIVLFVITLIIILVMREQDNHKRGVAGVRKITDQLKAEIASQEDQFRAEIAELEEKVNQKDSEIQQMFVDIDKQLSKISSYSSDLGKMRSAMETYREALCGLAKLTQDADVKISQVEDDVERLEEVKKVIDGFRLDMKDADEHLKQHEGLVIQVERDTVSRLEDRCKSLSEDFSIKIDRLCDQLDIKVEATRDATESLMNEGALVLGNIVDRSAEQIQLSSQIKELTRQKERLLSDITNLNRKVEERKAELEIPVIESVIASEPVLSPEPVAEPIVEPEHDESEPEPESKVVEPEVSVAEVPFEEPVEIEIEKEKVELDEDEEEIVFD